MSATKIYNVYINKPANSNSEGLVHFYLWVENLQQEVERLTELKDCFILKNGEVIYRVENGYL